MFPDWVRCRFLHTGAPLSHRAGDTCALGTQGKSHPPSGETFPSAFPFPPLLTPHSHLPCLPSWPRSFSLKGCFSRSLPSGIPAEDPELLRTPGHVSYNQGRLELQEESAGPFCAPLPAAAVFLPVRRSDVRDDPMRARALRGAPPSRAAAPMSGRRRRGTPCARLPS